VCEQAKRSILEKSWGGEAGVSLAAKKKENSLQVPKGGTGTDRTWRGERMGRGPGADTDSFGMIFRGDRGRLKAYWERNEATEKRVGGPEIGNFDQIPPFICS